MNILECQQITKIYQKKPALNGFDLRLSPGETLGLLGVNGAGKSTLVNIIAGSIRKSSGRLIVSDTEIQTDSFEYRRKIGFVLERPVWFDKLTVLEYLMFVGTMFGIDTEETRSRTGELIEYFDLTEKRDSRIESYSSGMKKKVSLAAALIHHPSLLILDEPFEGMDPISLKKATQLLLELKSNGVSIIIASHRLDSIEQLCDTIAIIDKGRNLYQDSVEHIFDTHRHNNGSGQRFHSLEDLFMSVLNVPASFPGRITWNTHSG